MYQKTLGTIVFALSFILSTTVFAHCGCEGHGMRHMIESLNLDATQKEKVKPILDNLKTTMKSAAGQMAEIEKQIKTQMMSTTMDQATVDGLVDKKTKLLGDLMKAKVAAKSQIYAILNPQQKTQLQNNMQKMEEKMAEKYKSCHEQD